MEWRFKRDTAFRKQFFVPDSFAHPAKMDAQLLIRIVEEYTKPGEVILDPMAGSGTTMLACTLGRYVILVELEGKFCKMCRDNWEVVRMHPQLGYEMGNCQIIQGDARSLEGICDKIITSPPYTNRMDGGMRGPRAGIVPYTDESPDSWFTQRDQNNLGNLPYGNIDAVITSPPYEGTEARDRSKEDWWDGERERRHAGGSTKIAKGYSVDHIITSPPYESGGHHADQTGAWGGQAQALSKEQANYGQSQGQIGNLKGDTYLSSMLQVYQQCFKVLKAGGLMILVTKNFIRNKKEIRLDEDTIKLCQEAGFKFVERHYRKLPAQSFWRTIYKQKYPDAPEITHEDILIFSTLTGGGDDRDRPEN